MTFLGANFVYNPKTGKIASYENYMKRGFMPSVEDMRTMLHLSYDDGDNGTRCLEVKQYEDGTVTFETSEGEAVMGNEQIDMLMNFLTQLRRTRYGVSTPYESDR